MTPRCLAFALALCLAAPVGASAQNALEACADPGLPASTALGLCREALRDPGLAPAQRARVLVNLGVAQAALERHRDAARSFDLAARTDPSLVVARANAARSLAALGEGQAALEQFDAALETAPRDAELWLGRGALRLRLGDAAGAISDLTRAIGYDRELDAAFFNRGLAHFEAGDPREAMLDFTEVIRRDPEDAAAHLWRARAKSEAGMADALVDFERAIALAPDWGEAWYRRGRHHDARGAREAANRDLLRAYELGVEDRWLAERVQAIGTE